MLTATSLGALLLAAPLPSQAAPDVERPSASGERVRWGDFRREHGGLVAPAFAAFDLEGRLWVSETHAGSLRAIAPDGSTAARFVLEARPGLLREPYGVAIAPDGQVLVADAVEQCVVVLDGSGATRRKIGRRGAGPGELREPRGLAIAGGRLYVADSGNHRVAVFDLDGKFERALGRRGTDQSGLLAPNDVAVDGQGRAFVADLGNHRVARFEADGSFGRAFGGLGPWAGLFHAPTGVAVHGSRVLVADRDNHRVQVLDADGKSDHEWGLHAVRPREGRGKLHYPSAVATDVRGRLVAVVEGSEGRVQVFGDEGDPTSDPPLVDRTGAAHYDGGCDAARNLLAVLEPSSPSVSIFDLAHPSPIEITRFGRFGAEAGKLLAPADVEFAADGRSVWITEPLLQRVSEYRLAYEPGGVLRFDPYMARFVRSLDLAQAPGIPAAPWPPEPGAIELGANGRFHVADRANGRVLVFDGDWAFVRALGEPGTGPGKLLEPAGLVVAADGTVFVADARGRKLQAFDPDGAPAGAFSVAGPSGADARPRGLAAADAGGLWVALEDAHALARLDSEGRPLALLSAGGLPGLGRREWFRPAGLARTPDGGLVAIDAGNHRLQVLNADGAYRTAWGARLFLEPLLTPGEGR
ncbi:MAG: hypothetical protein JNK02_14315 [Planctomycetes bacterium]|nr:hypothetical protein [Planctomycetota bacterium]